MRRREEAEDIAYQVFLEALRGIDRFEDRCRPILAWLYRIARNLIADDLRRRVSRTKVETLSRAEPDISPAADSSVEAMTLLDAISRLTIDQQEVLIQRFFMSLSARETAELLGKNETAVYALQVRAINSLSRILGPEVAELEAAVA